MQKSSRANKQSPPLGDVIDSPRTVYRRTSLSESTILRMRRRGEFPEPIAISPGRKGWWRSEVDAWLAHRRPGATRAPGVTPTGAPREVPSHDERLAVDLTTHDRP